MLYALLDHKAEIAPEHLMAALAVWTYCEQSARHIFGGRLGDPTADIILSALRQARPDGLTRTEISTACGRHASTDEIARALSVIHSNGLAKRQAEDTGGRSAERWFAM